MGLIFVVEQRSCKKNTLSFERVERRLGSLQMVSEQGSQHLDLMVSPTYRYDVNFVIWIWDFMYTNWHTCYGKDIIQYYDCQST